jgi:hypothetical protein
MKKYCCRELHQLEDDTWERWFGVKTIEKNKVEILCMVNSGYPKRIDIYTFNSCPLNGNKQ